MNTRKELLRKLAHSVAKGERTEVDNVTQKQQRIINPPPRCDESEAKHSAPRLPAPPIELRIHRRQREEKRSMNEADDDVDPARW